MAAFIQSHLQVTSTKTAFLHPLPIAQTTFAFILLHLQTSKTTFDSKLLYLQTTLTTFDYILLH